MNTEIVRINDFAGIQGFNPELFLDMSTWLGETIKSGGFEPETTRFIRDFLTGSKDCVCVDVGANIGYYTMLMSHLCKKVYAFEPALKFFSLMTQSCERNGVAEKCVLVKKGLSISKSICDLPVFDQSATFHANNVEEREYMETIELSTLDEEVSERIDLIKIDCDGHDPYVLYGATKTIQKYRPVIVLEIAPQCYSKAGIDLESFYLYIEGIGYRMCSEFHPNEKSSLEEILSYRNKNNVSSINVVCHPVV